MAQEPSVIARWFERKPVLLRRQERGQLCPPVAKAPACAGAQRRTSPLLVHAGASEVWALLANKNPWRR